MLWKKKKIETPEINSENTHPTKYPFRYCNIYISNRYNEILFVPIGKVDDWMYQELNSVIVKDWPLNIDELQNCIVETLNKWKESTERLKPDNNRWYSFNSSKSKSQHSFKVDYVQISITTDMENEYGPEEVERIIIKASPKDWQKDSYKLIGREHLLETKVAQVLIDIFKACVDIRTR